ncbi:hypothetical protein GCM10019016_009460 [Streptomyces prasinosporus]|uniref:Uncharacterized protein n=1 Tax=Streptomyces prasinosporus TaxID=68256 RepID=A0ABP6TFW2_9ACTN|nr:hypothetical protein GCM10010332_64260 [Streptomyces albogriseolus]
MLVPHQAVRRACRPAGASGSKGCPPRWSSQAPAHLAAAVAGELRQRYALLGPRAVSAAASERSRIITYNVFAAYLGTPDGSRSPEQDRRTLDLRKPPQTVHPRRTQVHRAPSIPACRAMLAFTQLLNFRLLPRLNNIGSIRL